MTIVLVISIFSVLYFVLALFFLPTPSEYEGSFPSDPAFLSDEFWTALSNGILRHLALLYEHIDASAIIGIVGLAFTTNLIYTVRKKVSEMREKEKEGKKGEIEIGEYVKWGFGSIISAIIYMAATLSGEPHKANIILLLSVSAFILYIIYPELGLLFAVKDWISRKTPKNQSRK